METPANYDVTPTIEYTLNNTLPVDTVTVDVRARGTYPEMGNATEGSAGLDLRAMLDEPLTLAPGECELVGSGIAVWLKDPCLAGFILPRSGLGHKHGIVLGNLVGLIDSDYQGELKVSLWNRSQTPYTIHPGDRIAQYVVMPVTPLALNLVSSFDTSTERGEGGFGSTGQQ